MKPKVLIIDDDPSILLLITQALSKEGYDVLTAASAAAARGVLATSEIDLCIVDLDLPDDSGINLVREFRRRSSLGIIILTGQLDETEQIVGLEVGADDYVTKPFSVRELRARVNALLRRSRPIALPLTLGGRHTNSRHAQGLAFGDFLCSISSRQVFDAKGQIVPLTAMEFDTLELFLKNPNQVLTRDQIMTALRGQDWASYDRSIDSLISRLRSKLGGKTAATSLIATVFSIGYCYRPPKN